MRFLMDTLKIVYARDGNHVMWDPMIGGCNFNLGGQIMIQLLVSVLLCLIPNLVYSGSQNFTTVDPMTGEVSVGNVQTAPNGSQSYNWVGPKGDVTTGFVSPPMGGTSNFNTFNSQTGQVGVGSIHTTPPNNAPIFMPTPPPSPSYGGKRYGR